MSGETYETMQRKASGAVPASAPLKLMEAEENLGECAAIAKDRWVKSLTVRNVNKPWQSLQYAHINAYSEFAHTSFWVEFVGDDAKWRLTVEGTCLERLYTLIQQGRMEWIREAARGFGQDGVLCITKISVEQVEEPTPQA